MRLARLEPGQQEKAVSLLASGAIKSIDEYLNRSAPNMPKVEEKDSSDGAIVAVAGAAFAAVAAIITAATHFREND